MHQYDCHVQTCRRTDTRRVEQFLNSSRRVSAVLVQASRESGARQNLVHSLETFSRLRGVVRLEACELSAGTEHLHRLGVRGVRTDCRANRSVWDTCEPIERMHVELPRNWHLELGLSARTAAALAPRLARIDRVFCLALDPEAADLEPSVQAALKWWLDMGNAYLKVVPGEFGSRAPKWLAAMVKSAPERVVLGSGWPLSSSLETYESLEHVNGYADGNAERLYQFPPGAGTH